jgi:mgtE-like transporter
LRKNSLKLRTRKPNIVTQTVVHTGFLLALSMVGETLAGLHLSAMTAELLLVPGLIVLYPAISDLRGDVGSSLGSRLSVGLHLGNPTARLVLNNVSSALTVSLLASAFIGLISELFCILSGLPSVGLTRLVMISIVSIPIASVLLTFITVVITLVSFYRGADPDNVIAPSLATIGDVVTVIGIFTAARLVTDSFSSSVITVVATSSALTILFCVSEYFVRANPSGIVASKRERPSRVVLENAPSTMISAVIGVISGITLHMNMESLASTPTLIALVPLVVGNAGIIGSVLGARLSTCLHLGDIGVWSFLENTLSLFVLGSLSPILMGFLVYFSLTVSAIPVLGLATLLMLCLEICLVTTSITMVITTILTFASHLCRLDPCNVVIPIVTSVGDIVGVLSLLGIASLHGLI